MKRVSRGGYQDVEGGVSVVVVEEEWGVGRSREEKRDRKTAGHCTRSRLGCPATAWRSATRLTSTGGATNVAQPAPAPPRSPSCRQLRIRLGQLALSACRQLPSSSSSTSSSPPDARTMSASLSPPRPSSESADCLSPILSPTASSADLSAAFRSSNSRPPYTNNFPPSSSTNGRRRLSTASSVVSLTSSVGTALDWRTSRDFVGGNGTGGGPNSSGGLLGAEKALDRKTSPALFMDWLM